MAGSPFREESREAYYLLHNISLNMFPCITNLILTYSIGTDRDGEPPTCILEMDFNGKFCKTLHYASPEALLDVIMAVFPGTGEPTHWYKLETSD